MGRMPKKKSRRIVVDGRPFRWRLRGFEEPGDNEWYSSSRSRSGIVSVQADCERPGRVCQFGIHGKNGDSVTPGSIELLIRHAMREGWDPDQKGIPFQVGSVELADFPSKMSVVCAVMES